MTSAINHQTFAEHFFLAFHFSVNGYSPNLDACETSYLDRIAVMAPGLVDPPQQGTTSFPQKPLVGPKEAFIGGPKAYSKSTEVNGTESQPPATHPNYLPVWDEEKKYVGLGLRGSAH